MSTSDDQPQGPPADLPAEPPGQWPAEPTPPSPPTQPDLTKPGGASAPSWDVTPPSPVPPPFTPPQPPPAFAPPPSPGQAYGAPPPGGPGWAAPPAGGPGGPGWPSGPGSGGAGPGGWPGGPGWQPPSADQVQREAKGFLGALFDFSFTYFVTPMIIKVVYLIATVALVLGWLILLVAGFSANAGIGLFVLILGPLFVLLYLALIRMTLEFYLAVVRMSEDVHLRLR